MRSPDSIDVDAYLARIGMAGAIRADLPTLQRMVAAHASVIPFENLDPYLGTPVSLDLASVQRKLVRGHRGGYCFEQNLLLGEALRAIGFAVTNLAARALWGQPEDAITARSHMLLRIDLDGEAWIADAGFGGPTPTGPLRLVPDLEQATPHEPYRLHCRGDEWRLLMCADAAWKTLYRFDLQPQYPIDYRGANWWTSTHPESRFVTSLAAARAPAGLRLSLRGREFAAHVTGGATERRTLRGAGEIRAVLETEFLIRLPRHPALNRKLDSLPA